MQVYNVALTITLAILLGEIYLFIKFPMVMGSLFMIAIAIMLILMKIAPYDHEIWPDLYKK